MRYSRRLAEEYGLSVRMAKRYIKEGMMLLDGQVMKKDLDSDEGVLELTAETKRPEVDPNDYLIREFDHLAFFDKPAGMHTDLQKPDDPITVEDIVKTYNPEYQLISRLDYTTDGVICAIRYGFFVFDTKKVYLAYVHGQMKDSVTMDNLIDADKKKKVKVLDKPGGHKTIFTPMEISENHTLVKAEMENASRHQLRAYLAYLGHPIIGDNLYGEDTTGRIMLHCKETYVNKFPGISNLTEDFKL